MPHLLPIDVDGRSLTISQAVPIANQLATSEVDEHGLRLVASVPELAATIIST